MIADRDLHRTARCRVFRGTGKSLVSFNFGGIQCIITGQRRDSNRRQQRFNIKTAIYCGGISSRIGQGRHNVVSPLRQCGKIGGRQGNSPLTVHAYQRRVVFTVQGYGDRTSLLFNRCDTAKRLTCFRFLQVKNIVAGQWQHSQRRRGEINGNVALYLSSISRRIFGNHGYRQGTGSQCRHIGCAEVQRPLTVSIGSGFPGFIANRHRDRLPAAFYAGRPRQGLSCSMFCAIDVAIAKRRIEDRLG